MSNDIQKLQLEERIRILCLKHAGNVEIIAKESNVSPELVSKIIAKIRRKRNEDVNALIGDSMAGYIVLGAEQRKAWLLAELQKESAKQIERRSCCHGRPVKVHNWENEEHYICTQCDKDCDTYEVDPRDQKLMIKLIAELRAEDAALVDFLERLGFVVSGKKEDENKGTTINNYNVALAASKLTPEDQKMVTEAGQLDPRTRESLRKDLEKRMIQEANFEPMDDGEKQ